MYDDDILTNKYYVEIKDINIPMILMRTFPFNKADVLRDFFVVVFCCFLFFVVVFFLGGGFFIENV